MMDADSSKVLDHSLDSLEIAFSDSTRKLVRKIRTEWQAVVKYKCDMSAKENELLTAKEKIMHLNETKIQNEKYLYATERRLENLKLSNIQLKNKLSNLKKEEERVTKNCSEKQEYIQAKIMIYKEKWQKRYESHYSKNPRVLEKQKSLEVMGELRKKLCLLNDEYQKCEKELFQAKCERNRRTTKESKFYPFNSFVVNIAKIYLDAKNTFGKCEAISQEIAFIENKINQLKTKQQNLISSKQPLNSINSEHTSVNAEPNAIDETDKEPRITKMNISERRSENFENDSINTNRMPNQTNISNSTCDNSNALYMKKNFVNKNVVIQKQTKVQKWMERLKIVSKFSITSEETEKQDKNNGRSNSSEILKTNEKDNPESNMESVREKLDKTSLVNVTKDSEISEIMDTLPLGNNSESDTSNNRDILAPPMRNVDTNANRFMSRYYPAQTVSSNNTSKYFRKNNSGTTMENLNNIVFSNKGVWDKDLRSFVPDDMKQKNQENVMDMDVDKSIIENDLQKEATNTFEDVMDIDEEIEIHNTFQGKNANEKLQEGMHCDLLESKDETARNLPLKDNEVNVNASLSNNSNGKIDYQIELDKMGNNKATETHEDTQNSASKSFTIENSNVSEKNIHQGEHETRQPFPSHNLNPQPIPMNTENYCNESHTENIRNDIDAKAINIKAQKETNITNSFPAISTPPIPILTTKKISKSQESTPKTCSRESNPALTKQIQNSASSDNSNFSPFKPDSISPGFAYTTRLMYQTNAPSTSNEPSPTLKEDLQNNMFATMTFLNNTLRSNTNFASVQSPEEDKTDFLASVYEDYLLDSPPMIKGTEKSMFVTSEDSPDKEDKDDFFPLFAGDNDQSSKDTKDKGAEFMFNFSSNSKTQSPDEDTGFKFLF